MPPEKGGVPKDGQRLRPSWRTHNGENAPDRADVRAEYDRLDEEFRFLDEFIKARAAAGVTQAEVAERIGTTQSAVARLESGRGKHSPSIATLEKYAHALGCRLELRLVNEKVTRKVEDRTPRSTGRVKKLRTGA